MPLAKTWYTGKSCLSPYPATDTLSIFSGSAVVDEKNSSGFGTRGNPPLVAIYTGFYRKEGTDPNDGSVIPQGTQAQFIAFSTDEGLTWTTYKKKYKGDDLRAR